MKKYQSGQTIIEAVVALTTLLLIVAAIAVVVVNGIYNSQYIRNQNLANKYAQQGMEFVRNIQVNDITTFLKFTNGTYCIDTSTSTLKIDDGKCSIISGTTNLKRTIEFVQSASPCQSTETKVTVTVSWTSSKCKTPGCHSSVVVSCLPFTNPQTQP